MMATIYSGDEECGDEITSGLFHDTYEGEIEQADMEREMEDGEDFGS